MKEKKPPRMFILSIVAEAVTEKAVLIKEGGRNIWLPKSQMQDPPEFEKGEQYDIEIPEWIAKKNGLIE